MSKTSKAWQQVDASSVSEGVRRLNPALFGQGASQAASPAPLRTPPPRRGKPRRAMHKAVKTQERFNRGIYAKHLESIVSQFNSGASDNESIHTCEATAAQRADAFLLTLATPEEGEPR